MISHEPEPAARPPVETKVKAATAAAALAGVAVWVLDRYLFGGDTPEPVEVLIYLIAPGLAAAAAGFWAHHTLRTDPKSGAGAAPPSE
jgi:hypothetical protein